MAEDKKQDEGLGNQVQPPGVNTQPAGGKKPAVSGTEDGQTAKAMMKKTSVDPKFKSDIDPNANELLEYMLELQKSLTLGGKSPGKAIFDQFTEDPAKIYGGKGAVSGPVGRGVIGAAGFISEKTGLSAVAERLSSKDNKESKQAVEPKVEPKVKPPDKPPKPSAKNPNKSTATQDEAPPEGVNASKAAIENGETVTLKTASTEGKGAKPLPGGLEEKIAEMKIREESGDLGYMKKFDKFENKERKEQTGFDDGLSVRETINLINKEPSTTSPETESQERLTESIVSQGGAASAAITASATRATRAEANPTTQDENKPKP